MDELASAYMALGDTSYLPTIVARIKEQAEAERIQQQEREERLLREKEEKEKERAERQRIEREQLESVLAERAKRAEARREKLEKFRAFILQTNVGRVVLAATIVITVATGALVYYLMLPEAIDERIVWNPKASAALSALNCGAVTNKECLSQFMKRNGASSQAVAFTSEIRDKLSRPNMRRDAYAERVTHFGPVSMVQVVFPFENQGIENEDFLLLSPDRTITDPNDSQFVGIDSPLGPSKQPAFSQLLNSFPNAVVWSVPAFDHEESSSQGGPRLVFKYPILNGCHACDQVGWAKLAFDFDSDGRFKGASVDRIVMQQPSFDCAKVKKWAELEVCATPSLAVKDAQMGSIYASDIRRGSLDDRRKLRASQRAWIKLRDQCQFNGGINCLAQVYAARIGVLSNAGPSGESEVAGVSAIQPATSSSPPPQASSSIQEQSVSPQPQSATPILAQGTEALDQTYSFDFEGGIDTPPIQQADVWLESQDGSRERTYIKPINGAQLALSSVADPGFGSCAQNHLSADALPLSSLSEGMYVCYRTRHGHMGQFRVVRITRTGPNNIFLVGLQFATWQ